MVGKLSGVAVRLSVFSLPPIDTKDPTAMIVPSKNEILIASVAHAVRFIIFPILSTRMISSA